VKIAKRRIKPMFEILHFRGSENILKDKGMDQNVQRTLEYLDNVLYGSIHRRELLRQALDETGWTQNRVLSVLDGRKYFYKGLKQRVALEGSLAVYEYILEGLLRLQIGFQKERIDMGILLLPAQRGDKSPYMSTKKLVEEEIQDLYPTIDLPVTVVLFDLGKPGESMKEAQTEVQTKNNITETKKLPQDTKFQKQDSHEVPSKNIPATEKSKPRKKRRFGFPSTN
jgi:hypothetical protein